MLFRLGDLLGNCFEIPLCRREVGDRCRYRDLVDRSGVCGKAECLVGEGEDCPAMHDAIRIPLPLCGHGNPCSSRPGLPDDHSEEPGTFAAVEAGDHFLLFWRTGISLFHQKIKSRCSTYAFWNEAGGTKGAVSHPLRRPEYLALSRYSPYFLYSLLL